MTDDDPAEECDVCEEPAPPGQSLCPGCEDLQAAARSLEYPPGDPPGRGRYPPHGGTTR